jgi:hypothetical protein
MLSIYVQLEDKRDLEEKRELGYETELDMKQSWI